MTNKQLDIPTSTKVSIPGVKDYFPTVSNGRGSRCQMDLASSTTQASVRSQE